MQVCHKNFLKVLFCVHPAEFKMTLYGAALALACDDAAALVLYGLKHLTSIPALSITLLIHLEIVAQATPLKGACVEMNICVS